MRRLLWVTMALAWAACGDRTAPISSTPQKSVELDSYVEKNQVVVGERVTFRVVLEHDAALPVDLQPASSDLDALPIVDEGTENSRPYPGRARRVRWYVLEPMRAQVLRLPSFEARYIDRTDQAQTVVSESVYLSVNSAPVDPESDIRDIWTPESAPDLPWQWIVVGAAAVLLTAFLLWRILVPRGIATKPELSAEELVRQRLDRLATVDVSTRAGARSFCFDLTEALKHYLETLCEVNASDLTTQEIAVAIEDTWIAHEQRTELVQVLRAADRVKFAGDRADVDELRRLHQIAVRFVDRAHPDPMVEERAS